MMNDNANYFYRNAQHIEQRVPGMRFYAVSQSLLRFESIKSLTISLSRSDTNPTLF